MARELAIQTDIKKSVIAQGGYALKLSNRFTIGVPDLGIWLAPFVPVVIEVKDLGVVVDNFHLQIGVTPKQTDTMLRMNAGYATPVTGMFLHAVHMGEHRLYWAPRSATRIRALDMPFFVRREPGGRYNIPGMLQHAGVSRI